MVTIDFRGMEDITLFIGRKSGKEAKSRLSVKDGDLFRFLANDNQVITSSFFLGLVGEELIRLLSKSKDINDLITKVDLSTLNKISRDECLIAIRRGIRTDDPAL